MAEALYLGAALYFVRSQSGSSDRDNKPDDITFQANKIGIADEIEITIEQEEREIRKPYPGRLRVIDVLSIGETERMEITLRDITPIFWELITGSGQLTSGSDVNYSAWVSAPHIKGWLKIQYYDADDTVQHVADRYVRMKIERVPIQQQEIQYRLSCVTLYSPLNSGVITTA